MADASLHDLLERLYRHTDHVARRERDPIRFAWRYPDPADRELAAILATSLAFGRVDLFLPVLDGMFDAMDAAGGPRRFVHLPARERARAWSGATYRWTRPADLVAFAGALARAMDGGLSLEPLFHGPGPLRSRLGAAIDALRAHAVAEARALGATATRFDALPQGLRYLLPHPDDGSACKRWNLTLRQLVRPATEGVDLGLWTTLRPAELVMPVDVHVGRLARFLGLTPRADAGWRTAEDITAALRAFDPHDPVRFDFALAHLGISGACLGHRDAAVCPSCPLDAHCRAPQAPARTGAVSTSRRTRG